jgi:transglutaminase-like putative cysteine protease
MIEPMTQPEYLKPARFIDSDAPNIVTFAREAAGTSGDQRERAIRLYLAVRDSVIYDPYVDYSDPGSYRASSVLERGRGYCVSKASLLAAVARAAGIPARVGYADVKNHMSSPRLYETLKTDIYRWHSYTELFLEGRWAKATPAFNLALCERLGVHPLEFDGRSDSLFQEYDPGGRRHMEYLKDRGSFADVPFDTIVADFRIHYPMMMKGGIEGDFQREAVAGDLG